MKTEFLGTQLPIIQAPMAGVQGPELAAAVANSGGLGSLPCAMMDREATTSPLHRAALKSDAARHTALTHVFTGRPARGIVNRLIREVGPFAKTAPVFPAAVLLSQLAEGL